MKNTKKKIGKSFIWCKKDENIFIPFRRQCTKLACHRNHHCIQLLQKVQFNRLLQKDDTNFWFYISFVTKYERTTQQFLHTHIEIRRYCNLFGIPVLYYVPISYLLSYMTIAKLAHSTLLLT